MLRRVPVLSIIMFCVVFFAFLPQKVFADQKEKHIPVRKKLFIIVLDKSVSMVKSDPKRYRYEAAQLALALSKRGDQLGIISFSEEADVIRALKEIKSNSEKNSLQERGFGIMGGRMTNFMAPVSRIMKMISGGEGTIIFLTDGDHNMRPKAESILNKVKQIGEKRWKFFTIALQTKDAKESKLLKQMGPLTGGANFKVNNAEDLISTYLYISNDIQHILQLEFKDKISVDVYPGVRRLILALILDPKSGPLKNIKMQVDGNPKALTNNMRKNIYRYPNAKLLKAGKKTKIQIINVENPAPGKWDIDLRGKVKQAYLLEEPPFAFEVIKGMPRKVHYDKEVIPLGINILALDGKLPEGLGKNTKITVSVTSESNPGNHIENIPLVLDTATSERDGVLAFRGNVIRGLSKPGIAESFNVFFRIAITDSQSPEFVWRHGKRTSFI